MPHNRSSQSALEYMMTYGWAILIIVIVAGGLYSLGIFNPTASAGTTVTGFSGLGVTEAACVNSVNNQVLELYVSNGVGYTVNVTKINITGSSNGVSLSQNVGSLLGAGQSGIFYVNGACNKSSSAYSGSATITYTEPGQTFSGPYFSSGKVFGVSNNVNPTLVANFTSPGLSLVNTSLRCLLCGATKFTISFWFSAQSLGTSQNGWLDEESVFGLKFVQPSAIYVCMYTFLWCDSGSYAFLVKTWYNIIVTWSSGSPLYVYVNDAPISYGVVSGTIITNPGMFFQIGPAISNRPSMSLNGSIANVQIYNEEFSSAQISQLYSEGIGGAPISSVGLIGWWPLDGNPNDYSGNNNNGVATNVQWVSP